jgi:hypothetical protein
MASVATVSFVAASTGVVAAQMTNNSVRGESAKDRTALTDCCNRSLEMGMLLLLLTLINPSRWAGLYTTLLSVLSFA